MRHAFAARSLCPRARQVLEAHPMLEPLLGLFVAIALGIYLVVTLLRPERF
ncbi:K(+)-transporting ATPase subunit F [Rhizobium helianthi]|uniref:K(+)-transporting ATPase subunit F n=1 Tax=Rhizobium helianthi TaxID=1132695 RepID=A0ABW4M8A0_9HYPH